MSAPAPRPGAPSARGGPGSRSQAAAAALLRQVPVFHGLPDDAVRELARAGTFGRYRTGSSVFFQGDVTDAVYVVASGRVKVSVTSARGDELVLAVLGVGDAVGELGALDGLPHAAGLEVLQEAELLRIEAAVVRSLLRTQPAFAEAVTVSLCRLVRQLAGASADLAFVDAPGRLARLLLDQADSTGRAVVDLGLTQPGVAGPGGTSPETVTESLEQFRRRGWVQLRGREVTLLDAEALRRYVER